MSFRWSAVSGESAQSSMSVRASNVTGLAPWAAGDSTQIVAANNGAVVFSPEFQFATPPAAGDTSISGQTIDWTAQFPNFAASGSASMKAPCAPGTSVAPAPTSERSASNSEPCQRSASDFCGDRRHRNGHRRCHAISCVKPMAVPNLSSPLYASVPDVLATS